MIYILAGIDTKKKSTYTSSLIKGREYTSVPEGENSKDMIMQFAHSTSMFGGEQAVSFINALSNSDIALTDTDLKGLQASSTTYIFLEDKLLATGEKKYKKYAEIVRFEEKAPLQKPKFNTFALADAFGNHDKVKAWTLYREAIESGVDPEPISGILFWKIKTMLLGGSRLFTADALKRQSSALVSLHHKSHRGETDFVIGLEQFILSSLSK